VILLVSLAVGLAGALFPPVNIEAYLVGVAALHTGPLLWGSVLTTTVGHMCGKLVFYSLGRGWLLHGLSGWINRKHDLDEALVPAQGSSGASGAGSERTAGTASEAAPDADAPARPGADAPAGPRSWRERVRAWGGLSRVEALAQRRWPTAGICALSAAAGVPPFAVVSVLLGRFRMRVGDFLVFGGLGRLVRFSAVAGLSGVVITHL
jgi:membrane protein YqaA with SNARE-associated domain